MFRQHGTGLNICHGQTPPMLDLMLGPLNAGQQGTNKVTLCHQEMQGTDKVTLQEAPMSKLVQSFPVTLGLGDRALTQHKMAITEVQRKQT